MEGIHGSWSIQNKTGQNPYKLSKIIKNPYII